MTKYWGNVPDRHLANDISCLGSAQAVLLLPRVPDDYRKRTTSRYALALASWGNERGRAVKDWPWRP